MSQGSINYNNSDFFDFTFLNPFAKTSEDIYFGTRFGFAQFILIIIGLLITVFLLFYKKTKKLSYLVSFIIWFVLTYYNVSCILIPNNHEKCYLFNWISISLYIMYSIILIVTIIMFDNILKEKNVSIDTILNIFKKNTHNTPATPIVATPTVATPTVATTTSAANAEKAAAAKKKINNIEIVKKIDNTPLKETYKI